MDLYNRLDNHCKKRGLFSVFHYGFSSSRSFLGLLTVVSDRIVRAFNRPRTSETYPETHILQNLRLAICLYFVFPLIIIGFDWI